MKKRLLLGLTLLLAIVLAAPAGARVKTKPCSGGCDDGDGPPIPAAPSGPIINTGPPPAIDDGDQPAAPDPPASPITPTSTGGISTTNPQVVTGPAPATPATVTTTTTAVPAPVSKPAPPPAAPKPPPVCANHPEFGQNPPPGWVKDPKTGSCSFDLCWNIGGVQSVLPDDDFNEPLIRDGDGNCTPRYRPASIELCKGDVSDLVSKDLVPGLLAQGFNLAIVVDGQDSTGRNLGLNCLITDLATYGDDSSEYVFSNTYVEGGDTHFPLYSCATPFGDATVPFYKFYVRKGTVAVPTAKEEPGCKPAAGRQTRLSVQLHGLQWGGHWFRDTQVFARVLAREGSSWRGWKRNHPALAQGLVAHSVSLRR